MPPPSKPPPGLVAAASIAFLAAMGGVYLGTRSVQTTGNVNAKVPWALNDTGTPTIPEGVTCAYYEARAANDSARTLLGLKKPSRKNDGGYAKEAETYLLARVCTAEVDPELRKPLLAGVASIEPSARQVAYEPGWPELEVWVEDEASPPPYACACAKGPDCYVPLRDGGYSTAPKSLTLDEGRFDGGDCRPTPCVELAGFPSFPASCEAWSAQ